MLNAPRPSVTAVFAQSLDGCIAFRTPEQGVRERAVFSTDEGAIHAHRARAAHDAVLVGIRTVLADDPLLSVRLCAPREGAQPRRVVLDSALAIPFTARLVTRGAGDRDEPSVEGGRVTVLGAAGRASDAGRRALEERGVDACILPASPDGRVSLTAALAALAERGVRTLLVEGGAAVLTSFLRARLVDRVEIDVAPALVGATGLASMGDLGVSALARAVRLEDVTVDRLGGNVLVRGRVVYPAAASDDRGGAA